MSTELALVDSNVLVYAFHNEAHFRQYPEIEVLTP
jgi:predicted nucleic acid-binding protein